MGGESPLCLLLFCVQELLPVTGREFVLPWLSAIGIRSQVSSTVNPADIFGVAVSADHLESARGFRFIHDGDGETDVYQNIVAHGSSGRTGKLDGFHDAGEGNPTGAKQRILAFRHFNYFSGDREAHGFERMGIGAFALRRWPARERARRHWAA